MQSSTSTGRDTLVRTLEEIEGIDSQIDGVEESLKELKRKRAKLEELALEEMTAARMERGVPAGARTWRIQWEHSMSVKKDRLDDVMAALKGEGVLEGMLDVSTAKVKSWLTERATKEQRDARGSYVDNTPLAGMVSEFVRPVLRHVTVSSRKADAEGQF